MRQRFRATENIIKAQEKRDAQHNIDVPLLPPSVEDARQATILSNALVSERVVPGVSEPVVAGVSEPVVTGVSEPVVAGVSEPVVAGVSEPVVAGVSEPVVAGVSEPVVAGVSEPVMAGVSEPVVAGVSEPVVAGVNNFIYVAGTIVISLAKLKCHSGISLSLSNICIIVNQVLHFILIVCSKL